MAVSLSNFYSNRGSGSSITVSNVAVPSGGGILVLTSVQDSNHANYPISSITRDGQSFTKIAHYEPAGNVRVEAWYLPTANVNTTNLVITPSGTLGEITGHVFVVTGHDTGSMEDAHNGGSGSGFAPSLSVTTTVADDLLAYLLCAEADITGDGSGQTLGADLTDQSYENARSSYKAAGAAGSKSMSASMASGQPYAHVVVAIKAAATGTTDNSERDARLTGTATANSTRGAHTVGDYELSVDQVEITFTTGTAVNDTRAAHLVGNLAANDERDAHLVGTDTANSERGAVTTGTLTANDERGAHTTGQVLTNDTRGAKITGTGGNTDERDAKVTGQLAANDERDAHLVGEAQANAERDAHLVGQATANDTRPAKVTGTDTDTDERGAKVTGTGGVTSQRDAKIHGTDVTQDTRPAKITGKDTANSTRPAKITGQAAANDTRGAKTIGQAAANDTRGGKVTGTDTANSERDAKIHGQVLIAEEIMAHLFGQAFTNSERGGKTTGDATASSTRGAKITGIFRVVRSRPLDMPGAYNGAILY